LFHSNNSAAPCIHHISRDGLGALLRGGKQAVGKCPTAGCKGQWKASTSEVDEVFKRKIERYLRMKEARTQHTQSHRPAIDAEEIS
jgi:SUMO ligase MMS21 Smc5/6 complex component